MTLWGGRFAQQPDKLAWCLNISLPVDQRLALEDVECSQAWAGAIMAAGVISADECAVIRAGLERIAGEFSHERFIFQETDEDIQRPSNVAWAS